MKIFTVEDEFARLAGPDVQYVSYDTAGHRLVVKFMVKGTDITASAYGPMRNGTSFTLMDATRACARQAQDFAYRATGKREADIIRLSQGKLK